MFCNKCGNELNDNAAFCPKCGATISQENDSKKEQTEKSMSKKKILFSVIIGIVVVMSISITVFLGMITDKDSSTVSKKEGNKKTTQKETQKEVQGEIEEEAEEEENPMILTKEIFYGEGGTYERTTEYTYDSQGNKIQGIEYDLHGTIRCYEEWDENGNSIKYESYTEDGKVEWGSEYEYDENGRRLREIHYNEFAVNNGYDYEYIYDEVGNLLSCVSIPIYESDITYKEEYTYDEDGNCVRKIYREILGKSTSVREYEYSYDEQGQITRMKSHEYGDSGSYGNEIRYEYDSEGNISLLTEYNMDGSLLSKTEYEYDKKGELKKTSKYDGEGNVIRWDEDIYDDEGKIIKSIYYDDGVMAFIDDKTEYIYDTNGYLIKEVMTSNLQNGYIGYTSETNYTNDANGRKIKAITESKSYSYQNEGEVEYESVTEQEFNKEGVLIKSTSTNSHGDKDIYQYDDYGNCLKYESYIIGDLSSRTEYVYEDKEEYIKNHEMYKSILDNALTEQKNTDDLSVLNYSYLFYDFNQDGSGELLLRKTDYYFDTIYLYSYIDNKIELITERQEVSRYEDISGITKNGFVIEGYANGFDYSYYVYEIKDYNTNLVADFHSYEGDENACSYEINIKGEKRVITNRAEYDTVVDKYLKENVVLYIDYNSAIWKTVF